MQVANLTEVDLKNIQKKEPEIVVRQTDRCYDKFYLSIIAECGFIAFVIAASFKSKILHIGTSIFGIFFLIEFFLSATFKFFCKKMPNSMAVQLIEKLKQSPPEIAWHISCYHEETVTVTDSNGNSSTETRRVYTHKADHQLVIQSWADSTNYSEILNHLNLLQYCRLYFAKGFGFDSQNSQTIYLELKKYFVLINKKDDYFDFLETINVNGFLEKVCAFSYGNCCNRVYSIPFYILMTFVGVGWLLRILFYKNSFNAKVNVVKVVRIAN